MERHSHQFVETYRGPLALGLSRKTDEAFFIVYLQKFSDDRLMEVLRKRFTDDEMARVVDLITELLRGHLTEDEYHRFFLKDRE